MFFYNDLLAETQKFCDYGVETGIIGHSELNQSIPYIFVGQKNGDYLIVQGAIHAREHLTALVTVCLAKYLLQNPQLKINGGIYFIPMSNPDGVRIAQEGVGWIENENVKNKLLSLNGNSGDFSLWKANAHGVDLNVNFDANWGKGEQNVFEPSPQNYVGEYAFSAAETKALAEFTERIKPCVTLSYHLKGEEIYWQFNQNARSAYRDKLIADAIAAYTGYNIKETPNSVGGYKDWCIQKLGIPAYTVEVGNDAFPHPFPYKELSVIVKQNQDLPRRLLNTVVRNKKRAAQAVDYESYYGAEGFIK